MAELGVVVVDIFLGVRQVPGRHSRFDRIGSEWIRQPRASAIRDSDGLQIRIGIPAAESEKGIFAR
ncbi:hypothetical protein TorRG33x02_331020, partial [Trema orientale]